MSRAVCRLPWPEAAIPTDPYDAKRKLRGGDFGAVLGRVRPHRGTDWSELHIRDLGLSTRVPCVAAGTVTWTHNADDGELGRMVEVKDGEGYYWTYCHLKAIDHGIVPGHVLHLATTFAVVGQSGSAAAFNHLHLQLAQHARADAGGAVLDPLAHIKARMTTTAGAGQSPAQPKEKTMTLVQNPAGTTYLLQFPHISDGVPGELLDDLEKIEGPVTPMSAAAEKWLRAQIAKQQPKATAGSTGTAPTATALAEAVLARLRAFWSSGK